MQGTQGELQTAAATHTTLFFSPLSHTSLTPAHRPLESQELIDALTQTNLTWPEKQICDCTSCFFFFTCQSRWLILTASTLPRTYY